MKRSLRISMVLIVLLVGLLGCVATPPEESPKGTGDIIPSSYLPNQGITLFVWMDENQQYVGNYLEGIESEIVYDDADKDMYGETQADFLSNLSYREDDMLFYFKGLQTPLSQDEINELQDVLLPVGQAKKVFEGANISQEEMVGVETVWTVAAWKQNNQWMFWSFYGLDYTFDKSQLASLELITFPLDQLEEIIGVYGNVNVYVRGKDEPLTTQQVVALSDAFQEVSTYIVYEGVPMD